MEVFNIKKGIFPSTIIITRQDGTVYDLGKMGYHVKTFDPPSSANTHVFQQVGRHGAELVDTSAGQITIPLVLDIIAYDTYDFELQRMRLNKIFSTQEEFYISTVRVPYIRWKVIAESFTMPQLNSYWKSSGVTINLDCADGYAETVNTTLTPFDFKHYETETYGLNLPNGRNLQYTWKEPNIQIYNASNIPLLAEEHPVTIIFKGNAPKGIKLKNKTTGQEINVYKSLITSDTLIWSGLVPIINGVQQYGNNLSDHGYLDFAVGWNELELTGATDFQISFDTRFYY